MLKPPQFFFDPCRSRLIPGAAPPRSPDALTPWQGRLSKRLGAIIVRWGGAALSMLRTVTKPLAAPGPQRRNKGFSRWFMKDCCGGRQNGGPSGARGPIARSLSPDQRSGGRDRPSPVENLRQSVENSGLFWGKPVENPRPFCGNPGENLRGVGLNDKNCKCFKNLELAGRRSRDRAPSRSSPNPTPNQTKPKLKGQSDPSA
jgi:hypothetical protein